MMNKMNIAIKTRDELRQNIESIFCGETVDFSELGLDEDSSYLFVDCTAYHDFQAGEQEYQLEYSLQIDDNRHVYSIDWPECKKRVGDEYVPCKDGEISDEVIYEEMIHALEGGAAPRECS